MPFVDAHTHQTGPPAMDTLALRNVIVGAIAPNLSPIDPADGLPCSVGIHPWYIGDTPNSQLAQLYELANLPNVRAIGECGLDRLRGPSLPIQQALFEQQVALSEEVRKPLIIHCVRAFSEIGTLYKRLKPIQPWVLHGVNNRLSVVKPLLDAGLYASFGAALLRPDSPACRVLPATRPDRLLLETDDQPIPIQTVYAAAAQQLGWTSDHLQNQLWQNAQAVFGW